MPNKTILILLSFLVAVLTLAAIYYLDDNRLSSIGSMVAASGGLLAVIWFTGSLWYQSQQLKEQREQFKEDFTQLREDSRRSALLLARDILHTAETRALSLNKNMTSLSELPTLYMHFAELKEIMESGDPLVVKQAIESWQKKEGPALALMNGLKNAAEVYFRSIGLNNIDYSKEPEEFVLIYGPHFWKLPFFEPYQSTGAMLAEFMVTLEPGRKAVTLALFGVMVKIAPSEKLVKIDSIRQDINKYKEKGYPIPVIAREL